MSTKTETRDRLVATAAELFVYQGYGATGVAQILRQAQANSGSLYHYFPTKEDLLIAVLEDYRRRLWPDLLTPIFDRVDDPIEKVFALMDGYRQMLLMTEFRHGCPIGNLAIEVCESHPKARELIQQNFEGWLAGVAGCFEAARERLPDDVDPSELALFVLTTMEGGVMLARSARSLDPFDRAITQLRDYVDRLVADGTSWNTPRGRSIPGDRDTGRPTSDKDSEHEPL